MKDKQTDFFPLFQARSLKATQDDTSTQLAELRRMMTNIIEHFQQEVYGYDIALSNTLVIPIFLHVNRRKMQLCVEKERNMHSGNKNKENNFVR